MPDSATEPEHSISFGDRIFRWLDSGLTQTFLGIVGGLGGTFLDGRCYLALMPFVPLAIHRNKVLEGIKRSRATTIYRVSATITLVFLYWLGTSLNRSRPNTYTPRDYANAVAGILPKSQPNVKRTAPKTSPGQKSNALKPDDIRVAVCQTELALNKVVVPSEKFDGPAECRVRIYSNSKIELRNSALRIYTFPFGVKIQTVPPAVTRPGAGGSMDEYFYEVPITQTLVKDGDAFTVVVQLPRLPRRYEIEFMILKDDGHSLGPWSITIIPIHETDS